MNTKRALVGVWLTLAALLSCLAILDILRWRGDPDFLRMGLTWVDSYLPHSILAAVTATALLSAHRIGRWITIAASSLFGLYFAAYLVFGGEGTFLLRVIVPLVFLCLAGVTLRYVVRGLSTQK